MVLGAEIGLAVMGLVALFTGKLTLSKTTVLHGIPARLLGLFCMAPVPIAFMILFAIAISIAAQGGDPSVIDGPDWKVTLWLIEVGTLISCCILLYAIGNAVAKAQERSRQIESSTMEMPFYKKDDGNPYAAP
jgi:hypothetical protein